MSDSGIQLQQQDGILTIRFNRPAKKNSVTTAMYAAMAEALHSAAGDSAVRVILFAGAPDSFSAGNDMRDFLRDQNPGDNNPILRFMRGLSQLDKPVLAAVNGLAIGIGVTLLLHCDLIYAGQGTRFQLPFVNIGICPEFASTFILPRTIGHMRAAELTLFGDFFSADQALEYGLINAVLPAAEVEAHALERAHILAQKPPAALRATKQLLKRWTRADIDQAIRVEADHFLPMLKGPEVKEAVSAFTEKRKPDFSRFY